MRNFRQRKWLFIAIAIAIITVITLIAAPNNGSGKSGNGSTYGKGPGGYGAWYEYMSRKDLTIDRWRQPFTELMKSESNNLAYIRVLSQNNYLVGASGISSQESAWVAKGNTLVILGKYEPATSAPFSSSIDYRQGTLSDNRIDIATTRRLDLSPEKVEPILEDAYGTVVWSSKIGKGEVIYSTTPYLAANAYQDNPDNYQFLAELVDDRRAIWVDEYIHGYQDRETAANESQATLLNYLVQTPWFLLFIQTVLIALVAAVTAFRRFGRPIKPRMAIADNSTAYIEALAGVLEKANSSDFVLKAIAKDERQKLQPTLGLGKSLVDSKTLVDAYQQQGGKIDLEQLLQESDSSQISDRQLSQWLQQWQQVNESQSKPTE